MLFIHHLSQKKLRGGRIPLLAQAIGHELSQQFQCAGVIQDEGIEDVVAAVRTAFDALDAERPRGIRYAYYRVPDTAQFVVLIELAEGVTDPLGGSEEVRALRATLAKWAVGGPPMPAPLVVLGSYEGLAR